MHLTVSEIRARAVIVPLSRPILTAAGPVESAPLVLIDIATAQGIDGCAYIFAYRPQALAPLVRLIEELAPQLDGRRIDPLDRQADLSRFFRLLGLQGLAGMAVSGIDMALWDILGREAGCSVAELLGAAPRPIRAYDSFGVIDPRTAPQELRKSVAHGFEAIKIKVGAGDFAADLAAVRTAREAIGPEIKLMIDYNQSLDPAEACRRIEKLRQFDLYWIEEPVAAEDFAGHARVRQAGVPVQTGENWWFPRDMQKAIAAGASDVAMVDLMKIGGVTGWTRAAALAEAASLPLSSHVFLEASAHTLAASPTADWIEHLDVASVILEAPIEPTGGTIEARGPGLGMTWKEKEVARLSV